MENVAHALAGLLVAQAAVALRARREAAAPSDRFRVHAAWVSALANNVPDADLVLTPLTGGKLGYLLHHRGHTHTLPIGLLLGAAVAAVTIALWRRRGGEAPTAKDRAWLLALGLAGPLVHLSMDGWNTYGVHPFWPFDDRWFYGDAVFIVEPLLWLAAVPFLWAETRSRAGRGVLAAIFLLGLVLPWVAGSFVPVSIRLFLIAFAALAVVIARVSGALRPLGGLVAFFAVPAVFLGAAMSAKATLRERAAETFPDEQVVDVTATGFPANPLCWSSVIVSTTKDALVLRRARLALWPSWLAADACPAPAERTTATIAQVDAWASAELSWHGEHHLSLERLRELAGDRCDVAAAMRFVRAPFLVDRDGGMVLGDLRFDRDEGLDFAELELPAAQGACPAWVPPWVPPRAAELAAPR